MGVALDKGDIKAHGLQSVGFQTTMMPSDKLLVMLLRFLGISALFAVGAVFMPLSWMAATHRWLGLGAMPTEPIVEYLARCLSAFYAISGGYCLVMASDVERYRPLIRYLGVAQLVLGVIVVGVDMSAGLPWWWSAVEGPFGVVVGGLMVYLARPGDAVRAHEPPFDAGRRGSPAGIE